MDHPNLKHDNSVLLKSYIDIFVNCNWVVTPSWQVIPWHLPCNWGKSTEKPQSG